MYLEELFIENYKGFGHGDNTQKIKFAIPQAEKAGSGLTIIVGPNNSGKSTIFEVIRACFGQNLRLGVDVRDSTQTTRVKVTYTQSGFLHSPPSPALLSSPEFKFYELIQDADGIPNRNGTIISDGKYSHLYDTDQTLEERFLHLQADKELRERCNEIIQQIQPSFSKIKWESNRYGPHLFYESGYSHETIWTGDGIRRAMLYGFRLMQLEKPNQIGISPNIGIPDHPYPWLIDEPETYLHPQACKCLASFLAQESSKRQVIIITHSPYFIRMEDIENGAQIIRASKKDGRFCKLQSVKNETLCNLKKEWKKPYLFDEVAREIFFADKVLFCEGMEDAVLLRNFAQKENLTLKFDVFGYGVGSVSYMEGFMKLAHELDIDAAALLDFPSNESAYKDLTGNTDKYQKLEKERKENQRILNWNDMQSEGKKSERWTDEFGKHLRFWPTTDIRQKPSEEANLKKKKIDEIFNAQPEKSLEDLKKIFEEEFRKQERDGLFNSQGEILPDTDQKLFARKICMELFQELEEGFNNGHFTFTKPSY